jgi:NADPH:quinone reductase-like Zn-dependent oxidoreductase
MTERTLPTTMMAMLTIGHGDYDQLVYREVPMPTLQAGEVLLQVLAAGVNNTDINTRVGWYGAGWNSATPFPLIQGADCCGRIVAMALGVTGQTLGQRVLVRSCMRVTGFGDMDTRWLGTDFDGAFAQYVKVPASEVFAVNTPWSDAELASLPCSWGTAENMLERARVRAGEQLWVTGASGGVGSAVVQLAKRRGAVVTAITSRDKSTQVAQLGADRVLCREDGVAALAALEAPNVVVDNVVGSGFAALLKMLRRGGRYVTSGAIAGADVALDMRDLYLRDITLIGSTAWDEVVFPHLMGYVERNEIRSVMAATYPLKDMALAQQAFLEKRHTGNLVLLP